MTTTEDLRPIWQITGDAVALMTRLGLDPREQNPRLRIHAGQGTLEQAQREGSNFQILQNPKAIPEPLLAFGAINVFEQADIFASDAACLVVGLNFISEFSDEIQTSCHESTVKVIMYGSSKLLLMDREQLLEHTLEGVNLYAITPIETIKTQQPIKQDNKVYIPATEDIPPFFRVPWKISSIYIRDDIKQRIEAKMRGAEFNLTALMP